MHQTIFHLRKRLLIMCIVLSLILIAGIGGIEISRSAAQAGASMEILVPPPGTILEAHEPITITIRLAGEDIYGYHFRLSFDNTLLYAEAAGFVRDFFDPAFSPPGWEAEIDQTAGRVNFAATLFRPATPVSGEGDIAWVRFIGLSPAILPADAILSLTETMLATRDGDPIIPSTMPASVRVLPKAIIHGRARLQGRTDWSGAVANLSPATASITTDSQGWYTFTVPAGIYQLSIEMARYLDAEYSRDFTRGDHLLDTVRLLAGDTNDDDIIDILDISYIGGKYGMTVDPITERGDVNADGMIDILDLSLTGGNFWATSPVPWY